MNHFLCSADYLDSNAVKYNPFPLGSEIHGFFPLPIIIIFPSLVAKFLPF